MFPTIFSFGPFHIHSYGVMVAVGVMFGITLMNRLAGKINISSDTIIDVSTVVLITGFLSARLFYVAQFWPVYVSAPLNILKIWEGGLVVYGGLIGGLIGFATYVKLKKFSFLVMLDLFTPATALAQGFGRIGCFLNGCCFGTPSHMPWAVKFPFLNTHVHPTQLYESLFCFVLAGFLVWIWKKRLQAGIVSALYFMLYAAGRFVLEFFRGDNPKVLYGLTGYQYVSLFVILSAIVGLSIILHGKRNISRPA